MGNIERLVKNLNFEQLSSEFLHKDYVLQPFLFRDGFSFEWTHPNVYVLESHWPEMLKSQSLILLR